MCHAGIRLLSEVLLDKVGLRVGAVAQHWQLNSVLCSLLGVRAKQVRSSVSLCLASGQGLSHAVGASIGLLVRFTVEGGHHHGGLRG